MDACGTVRTVFGFGCGLDWRPTVFRTAFRQHMACSACDLVCPIAGVLPCTHVLCFRCYDRCVTQGRCQCPLDARVCDREDVTWLTLTKGCLLSFQIQCWNAWNGCPAVGPASQILEHFNDCQYYGVTCRRCRRTVAHKDTVDHLKCGNCDQE